MKWKKAWKRLLCPPAWCIVPLTLLSAAALAYVFGTGLTDSPIAYAIYAIAFYTLLVVCIFLATRFPKLYQKTKRRIYAHPLGKRYMTDLTFRNHISLYCSLVINLFYAGTNLFSALLYASGWPGILAGYYGILAVMRFLLARYLHKNGLGENRLSELHCARACATILTTISLVLPGVIFMVLYQKKSFSYHEILIYIMAIYTFYMTISAVVELIKYQKYDNPILSTIKVIKTAAALVSMLSLEAAMFSQFGEKLSSEHQRIMLIATGAGVNLIIIVMAVYIIVRTSKETNEIGRQSQNGT